MNTTPAPALPFDYSPGELFSAAPPTAATLRHEETQATRLQSRAPTDRRSPDLDAASDADEWLLHQGESAIEGLTLISLLGKGGMGRVYLAHHILFNFKVAVKVVRTDDEQQIRRFVGEASLLATMHHENLVRIFTADFVKGRPYIVQELVVGQDLKKLLQQVGRLDWRQAVDYAAQAAAGLGAAHQAGIVHRDIKPANLLITTQRKVKIVDFGLAYDANLAQSSPDSSTIAGTPAYMAPEQARDVKRAGARADVYSLGVTLYQMLSGEAPYKRTGKTNILLAHIQDPVPDITEKVKGLPAPLISLLRRMLAKNPDQRPADGNVLAEELRAVLARPRTPWLRRGAVLGVCLAGALICAGDLWRPAWLGRIHQAPRASVPLALESVRTSVVPGATHVEAEPWQTPSRAVFTLHGDAVAGAEVRIVAALHASGVVIIDREHIDRWISEAQWARKGELSPDTAVRIGHIIGGHVALCVRKVAERMEIRTILVETGELVSDEVCDSEGVGRDVRRAVDCALALLPARGRVVRVDLSGATVSLGTTHGIHPGDRLELFSGTEEHPGKVCGLATVMRVTSDSAVISAAPGTTALVPGALVSRPVQ
jgi:serine/threonine protein kinase